MSRRQCQRLASRALNTPPIRPSNEPRQLLRQQQQPRQSTTTTTTTTTILRHYSASPKTFPDSPTPKPDIDPSAPSMAKIAGTLRDSGLVGRLAEPYAAYGTTEDIFRMCQAAGDYALIPSSSSSSSADPALDPKSITSSHPSARILKTPTGEDLCHPFGRTWHTMYSLPPTFATWAQLSFLHLWAVHTRLRAFPAQHARRWSQNMLDHFFFAAEERMDTLHGLTAKGIRGRYLKDLFEQWRGAEVSYDQGLVGGDAVMATALWRNVFQGSGEVDAEVLAQMTAWARRTVGILGDLGDAEFAGVKWRFEEPWARRAEVKKVTKGMSEPSVGEGVAGS